MASLEMRAVAKAFDGLRVLDGVDLHVPDGTTLSLLGPSGSGKSTLLRIVAGLDRPDAGAVLLAGEDMTRRPTHERAVGVVFQDQALFPHLDVAANVGFGLRMAGVERAERGRRVGEALALVGLSGQEHRDPATLSGGESQRVALARALAPRPRVLLMDEPLAALDQLLRERLLVELRSLFVELAVTVVAVTHDPTEAAALGDRVAVLVDGRLAREGTAAEVLARPGSAAVAALVGQRNVLPGLALAGRIETPLGTLPVAAPPGDVHVLVPPAALRADPDGSVEGVVRTLLPRAGTPFAVVTVGGRGLDVLADPSWQVGDVVRLTVDLAAVQLLDR